MCKPPTGRRVTNRLVPVIFGACLALIGTIVVAVRAQDRPRGATSPGTIGSYPRLPDAVTKPPDWIGIDAPFDVARFFAAPPRDRNAAPLYLDALFEFSAGMDRCFPPGPERDRRRRAAEDRAKRFQATMQPLYNDPNAVSVATVDEFIKRYDVGFRKLAEAQRRDRCVFESSLTFVVGRDAVMNPLLDAARTVTRIASLRVQRAVQRGDFDGAIRDVETVLRLAVDLRPRSGFGTHLLSSALIQVAGSSMVQAILASPGLRVAHCDRLLKAITRHDAALANDGYEEVVRAEYLSARVLLRDLVGNQPRLAAQVGLKRGESVIKVVLATDLRGIVLPADVDDRLARTSPTELARRVRELNAYYRALLALESLPFSERLRRITVLKTNGGDDALSRVVQALEMSSEVEILLRTTTRAAATVAATECLIVMRRWQLAHRGLPRSLASIVKEAGLKAVPIDPYDGKPMRLAVIEGKPVVYSVGRDGNDDGGLKDSDRDMRPAGDLLYRLPPIAVQRGIRPA